MQTYVSFTYHLLPLILLAGCASTTPITSVSNETPPPWVGTPARGSPPQSEHLLPNGIRNGDNVLTQDILLWLIWEISKSRIWFPGQSSENDLSSLPDGSEEDLRWIGSTQPDSASGHHTLTDKGSIFWINPIMGTKYPLNLIPVSQDDLDVIPTAYGEQYYPILK